MTQKEIETLAKVMAQELRASIPPVIAGYRLPTFDISTSSSCCEGYCPCYSRGGGDCPCNTNCGCHGRETNFSDIDLISQISSLSPSQIKTIFEASNMIQQIRRGLTLRKADEKN